MTDQRATVLILVMQTKHGISVHFCCSQKGNNKLAGSDSDLWIPLSATTDISKVDFKEIECIMELNRVANNVTKIEPVRNNGSTCYEYLVTYNEYVKAA